MLAGEDTLSHQSHLKLQMNQKKRRQFAAAGKDMVAGEHFLSHANPLLTPQHHDTHEAFEWASFSLFLFAIKNDY